MDNSNIIPDNDTREQSRSAIPARMRVGMSNMARTQAQRLREQKHLTETKLSHLEDSLETLRTQMRWLRSWEEVQLAQKEEKQRLYELNKQYAAISDSEQRLRRFETFEHMLGCYQRVQMLEKQCQAVRVAMQELERTDERAVLQSADQDKVQQRMVEERETADLRLQQAMDNIFESIQLEREIETKDSYLNYLNEELSRLNDVFDGLTREHDELLSEIDLQQTQLEHHRTGRQNMETHRRMMVDGESVLVHLIYLRDSNKMLVDLKRKQQETEKKQDEENTLLGQIFSEYQDLVADIETVSGELQSHRTYTVGTDRTKLEGRTQQLKTRRQMLMSAQSLWNRITTGYNSIDAKTHNLTASRLKIESTEQDLRYTEEKASRLERLCHEKEYTYMLSKSQNVIQLRADLKEGIACSVCGAPHHPYHSDTMLEQSILINDFKTDYEMIAAENRTLQKMLVDLRIELATMQGRYRAEETALVDLQKRQEEDVREWTTFASLDRTFADCSPSTNFEARQALIRQLLDNIGREAEDAQKELDNFNFHQEQIAQLNEKLQQMEQRKSELNVRLNEVNTACQVLASLHEYLQGQIETITDEYSFIYNELDAKITLPDWLREWKSNHESVKGRIQQMMDVWNTLTAQIQEEEGELHVLNVRETEMKQRMQQLKTMRDEMMRQIEQVQEDIKKCENEHKHLTNGNTGLRLYQQLMEDVKTANRREEAEKRVTSQMHVEVERIKGRNDFYQQQLASLNEQLLAQRAELDIFIRNYNMHNPPIQYAELDRIFDEGYDWNDLRGRVHNLIVDRAVSQERVDELNSRIISLQAEGGRSNVSEGLQSQLVDQYHGLQEKQREIHLQLARINILLDEIDNQPSSED